MNKPEQKRERDWTPVVIRAAGIAAGLAAAAWVYGQVQNPNAPKLGDNAPIAGSPDASGGRSGGGT